MYERAAARKEGGNEVRKGNVRKSARKRRQIASHLFQFLRELMSDSTALSHENIFPSLRDSGEVSGEIKGSGYASSANIRRLGV